MLTCSINGSTKCWLGLAAGVAFAGGLLAGLAPRTSETAHVESSNSASASRSDSSLATTWGVDNVHSAIVFRVKHMNVAWFYGRFNEISGTATWDQANISGSSLNFEVKTASIDTNSSGRDKHLRNTDFFNADQFPTCSFKSTSIAAKGENTFTVKGDLTMNGTTKPIEITLEKTGEGAGRGGTQLLGLASEFTINRRDFGVNYGANEVLSDEVKLMVGLELIKQ
jgi:polyisoprenoid-binding protein YceI